jgi:hypothetical protein
VVDRHLNGEAKRAILSMGPDDIMTDNKEIEILEDYKNATIEFEEDISDDEEI